MSLFVCANLKAVLRSAPMIDRSLKSLVKSSSQNFPVVAIIGPRQVGKSTMAKEILAEIPNSVYLDLEKPEDLNIFTSSSEYLRDNASNLLCIDEIQRQPELFPSLRSLIDEFDRKPRYLILGSASPELLRQSSESLAGRIKYLELSPFNIEEVEDKSLKKLWLRGGYPLSFLSKSDLGSYEWREAFVSTYIERDLPGLGFRRSSSLVRRVWEMLSHYNGQILNKSKISQSLGLSSQALSGYIEMLEDTFMIRVLKPFEANTKKRLIKSPKLFIRDTGILNYLLRIKNWEELYRHPSIGDCWESLVVENILNSIDKEWHASFFRTRKGEELDLVLKRGNKLIAIECKSSSAPKLTKENYLAIETLKPSKVFLVAPVSKSFNVNKTTKALSLIEALKEIRKL